MATKMKVYAYGSASSRRGRLVVATTSLKRAAALFTEHDGDKVSAYYLSNMGDVSSNGTDRTGGLGAVGEQEVAIALSQPEVPFYGLAGQDRVVTWYPRVDGFTVFPPFRVRMVPVVEQVV